MHRWLPIVLVFIAVAGIPADPAIADDGKICSGTGDAAIAACSRQIATGRWKGRHLSNFYNNRGNAYVWKGEYDRGIADSTEAIRIDPTNPYPYSIRGWAYGAKGELDRAIADLNEAIRLNPKIPQAYANRGFAYNGKGEYDRALSDLDEAIRLNPKLAGAYVNRGISYIQKGDTDRAIADLNEGLRLEPKDPNAYSSRALAYGTKGDYDRAIADANEAIRLNPKHAAAIVTRSFAYNKKGDYDRAIADASEAIRIVPNDDSAFINRGYAYNNKRDYDRAMADLNEAIRLAPKQSQGYKNRGIAFEGKGDLKSALADFREAVRLWPQNPEALEGIRRVEPKVASATPQVAPQVTPQITPQPSPPPPPAVAATRDGPRVALVIGNGKYRHANVLPNPANDATDISHVLRKLGFDVVEGRDLDKRGMDEKLREFGRKLDNAGLALFFYAGHGLQVGGKNFLVPVDAKLERAGDLNLDAVDVGNVLAQMEAERRVNLIFLDACRDNPLARSFARSLGTRSTSVGQGLASIQSAVGTMIAYATQPDAVALDGDGRNSPFTTALLKHLSTPGLEIAPLMRKVRSDVVAVTRGKQVPWDHSSLMGDVVLAR